MIPKRVLKHPQHSNVSTSSKVRCPKGPQTDWDSPSSYTGTVKRRPASLLEATRIDCDDDDNDEDFDCSFNISPNARGLKDIHDVTESKCDATPQEIVQGNCVRNEKKKGNESRESRPPISTTLHRKSKLKLPASMSATTSSKTITKSSSPSSTNWQHSNSSSSKSNLPKLSQIKKTQNLIGKRIAATTTQVQKSAAGKHLPRTVVTATPPPENTLNLSQFNKNRQLKVVQQQPRYSPKAANTFTELYRDYPVDYASTAVVESIPLQPPPYCNPPSPPPPCKQKNHFDEVVAEEAAATQKIRFATPPSNDDKLQQSEAAATVAKNDVPPQTTANKLANEIQRFKGNLVALQKFPSISKLSISRNYRFLSTKSSSDFALNTKNHLEKDEFTIKRVASNDYVLFNPTRQNSPVKMATAKSPNHLAKPEFSSSVFANIPVRPRKGIPHLENYCLFDPSTDFVNEKELKRSDEMRPDEELIEEIIYEDQLVYDILDAPGDENDTDAVPYHYFAKIDEVNESSSSSSQLTSSPDPMLSSVIETSSPNVDSTEEQALRTEYQTTLRKPLKIDKLHRHSSLPIPKGAAADDSSLNFAPSSSTSLPPPQKQVDEQPPLKQSVSSPQLQHPRVGRHSHKLPLAESNYVLFQPAPVHSRIQYKIRRQPRPLSTHSDADSGFLSPVTPTDGNGGAAASAAISATDATAETNKSSILVLQQCDSIQGYIEVIFSIF